MDEQFIITRSKIEEIVRQVVETIHEENNAKVKGVVKSTLLAALHEDPLPDVKHTVLRKDCTFYRNIEHISSKDNRLVRWWKRWRADWHNRLIVYDRQLPTPNDILLHGIESPFWEYFECEVLQKVNPHHKKRKSQEFDIENGRVFKTIEQTTTGWRVRAVSVVRWDGNDIALAVYTPERISRHR